MGSGPGGAMAGGPTRVSCHRLLAFLTGLGGTWGLRETGVVTGRGFAAPPVLGFGSAPAHSWETSDEGYGGYQQHTASRVFEYQPSEGSFGGQRDFSGVYAVQRPSFGGGDQSDNYWSQNDPYYGSSESYTHESEPYYGSSESYTQESDPYGVGGSPYATGQINDYDGGLSGVSYSDQSEKSWGDLQAPWQATPPYRTSGSSRALETPFRTKDLSLMQPYYANINTLPGPQLKSEVPDSRLTSYQTDFTAQGDQTEVLRRLHQLYRRVRRKRPGYGLSG